jgi:hypothetical protein
MAKSFKNFKNFKNFKKGKRGGTRKILRKKKLIIEEALEPVDVDADINTDINTDINNKYSHPNIVTMFLQMLNTVKLYHWKTTSYAQHKATDELYSSLNSSIDSFVEIMLGKKGTRVNLVGTKSIPLHDYKELPGFKDEIEMYKNYLIGLTLGPKNSDLLNTRDEILGHLNQFTYLLTFK